MYDNMTTYRIWAPDDARWTAWAKPVLFAQPPVYNEAPLSPEKPAWIYAVDRDAMIIVDLPGEQGVLEGLALAQMGARPVPLYNGVCAPTAQSAAVPVDDIVTALYKGALVLNGLSLSPDAPPAFLLDANRMRGAGKVPGQYDNRWCVFAQDMPSAGYLHQMGITRILLRTNQVQNDLTHVLHRYTKQGIPVTLFGATGPVTEMDVMRPSRFGSLFYRFKVTAGLTRNAAGGFGGKIPEPSQAHYGYG